MVYLQAAPALQKYPDSEEPEHCVSIDSIPIHLPIEFACYSTELNTDKNHYEKGWSIHNGTDLPVFRALADMPERASVFAGAMTHHSMLPGFSPQYLAQYFPWGTNEGFTVVDVGGGLGHVSRALAESNPIVKCIVEDAPDVVAQGREKLPSELRDRISFQAHDFFEKQPVEGADVYLLRLVLHDWSDKYAKMIIQSLIPALKPGAKVVINDRVIPGRHQVHYLAEREAR